MNEQTKMVAILLFQFSRRAQDEGKIELAHDANLKALAICIKLLD